MRNNPLVHIKRSLSRSFSREDSLADRIFGDALAHMYYEDWTSDILPYVYRDSGKKFKIEIDPVVQRDFVTGLFKTNEYGDETPEEGLSEFVKEVGQCLILAGGAAYELCEAEEGGKHRFYLDLLDYKTLRITGNQVIQSFRMSDREQSTVRNSVEKSKVLYIETPPWIEGGRGFQDTIENLLSLSNQNFGSFKFLEKSARGEPTLFNYSEFREFQEVSVLKETEDSGWWGRSLYDSKMTEFYYCSRYLKFKRSQTRLRDHIFDNLNLFLLNAANHGLPSVKISVSGLPTLGQIDELARDLKEGKIGFLELLKRFKTI